MRFRRFALATLAILLACPAWAAPWQKIAAALDRWGRPGTAALRAPGAEPLAEPAIRDLVGVFTDRGFVVIPAVNGGGVPPDASLTVEVRREDGRWVAALRRTSDGAFLALDEAGPPEPGSKGTPPPAPRPAGQAAPAPSPSPERPPAARTVELSDRPRGLCAVGGEIALLYDDRVVRAAMGPDGLRELARFPAPVRPSRALWIDAGDADGDGTPELAVTWAEDVSQVYEGTDSRPRSVVLTWPGLEPASEVLPGYLRIVGGRALFQRRGRFSAFEGPVAALAPEGGRWQVRGAADWPADHALYEATPLPDGRWLSHRPGERWRLQGPGGTPGRAVLLTDLGRFPGPAVAVRLETPEFRSGFEKEDRVTERWVGLPRRVIVDPATGAIYTIRRGRSPGLPLVGRPSGADAVVRLEPGGGGIAAEEPYGRVELFVMDFALADDGGAVLLANEREDGRGAAFLWIARP
ncbi:hypothetical protein [Deferrisoma palaeochoriense]